MAAEQPGIMKCQEHWHLLTQPAERSQIKVSAMQVVTVDNVGSLPGQVEKSPSPGEAEVFNAQMVIQRPTRLSQRSSETPDPFHSPYPAADRCQTRMHSQPKTLPSCVDLGIRNQQDIRIMAMLLAHRQPRSISAPSVRLTETQSDQPSATPSILGGDLQYA